MSTSTTNYGLVKQDISEPVDINIFRANIRKVLRTLKGITLNTAEGNHQLFMTMRVPSGTGQIATNAGPGFDLTKTAWAKTPVPGTNPKLFANWNGTMGDAGPYTSSYIDFNRPGLYRVSWSWKVLHSGTGTSGFLATGIAASDNGSTINANSRLIPGSFIAEDKNTQSTTQTISHEVLVKATEQDETNGDVQVANSALNAGDSPYNGYYIFLRSEGDAPTATVQAVDSWVLNEYVGPL
jgi:hypothetical protein